MDCARDPQHLLYQESVHSAFKDIYTCLQIDNADSDLLAEELEISVRMVHSHRKQRGYADDFSNCPLILNDQFDTEPNEGAQTPSSRSYPSTSLTVHPSSSFPLCPKTFTSFPKLSPELRQKIWHLCAPEHGRVIELNMSEDSIFPTKHPAHAVFHVNRESRKELLSVMGYETLMLENNRSLRIEAWSRDAVINFTHEVLFLNTPRTESSIERYLSGRKAKIPNMILALKQAMNQDQLERIKTLALSIQWGWELMTELTCHLPAFQGLPTFRGLETLILVLEKECDVKKKEIVLSRINGRTSLYDQDLWIASCTLQGNAKNTIRRIQRGSYTSWNAPELVMCLKHTRDWNQERFIPEFTWKKVPLKEDPWKHRH
ncbi:uncharacterized protein EAF02_003980 [Botrytis sinoallii]|uniref:uncharacterized protein n=1 Tax=Botrytis sinoallii TaxID=1463999 RepID=UPI0019020CD2|nr:uncharacterized protein EAF02_003980 [Botrytis sinoallii]KAF7885471.1 hypothetical protein EAF02_003980 [Botrytis sinoallii]